MATTKPQSPTATDSTTSHADSRVLKPKCIFSDRMSPLPEVRPGTVLFDAPASDKQKSCWKVEVRRGVRESIVHKTILWDHSFAAAQAEADKGLPKANSPPARSGPVIRLPSDRSSMVVGYDGSVGLYYQPRFVHGNSLVNLTAATRNHMAVELPKPTFPLPPPPERNESETTTHSGGESTRGRGSGSTRGRGRGRGCGVGRGRGRDNGATCGVGGEVTVMT